MNKVDFTELAELVYDYKHNAPLSVYSSLIMCAVIGLIVLISFIGSTIIDNEIVNFITLFFTILYILVLIKFRPFTAKINIDEGRHLRDPDRIVSYILSKQSGDRWLYSIFMNIEKAFSKEFGNLQLNARENISHLIKNSEVDIVELLVRLQIRQIERSMALQSITIIWRMV